LRFGITELLEVSLHDVLQGSALPKPTCETIKKYGYKFTPFTSNIDSKRWINVPFAYEPFWEKQEEARRGAKGCSLRLANRRGSNTQNGSCAQEKDMTTNDDR
jgi:hypothetical protein